MGCGDLYWSVIEPIWEKVSLYDGVDVYFGQLQVMTEPQRVLFVTHWCQSEIRNGGLHQFFSNATGIAAPEALLGFRVLGLDGAAVALEQGMAFFGAAYPRDERVRNIRLERHAVENPDDWDPFSALDDLFFDGIDVSSDGFGRAADAFAANHVAV